jgi:hypothetical protein
VIQPDTVTHRVRFASGCAQSLLNQHRRVLRAYDPPVLLVPFGSTEEVRGVEGGVAPTQKGPFDLRATNQYV